MCETCNKNNTHEHTLELWRGEGEDEAGNRDTNQQQTPEQILQRRIQTLLHTLQCHNQDQCRTRNCALLKKLTRHASRHMQFKQNSCTYCYNFFSLILKHSKMCIDAKCNVSVQMCYMRCSQSPLLSFFLIGPVLPQIEN